MTMSPFWSLKLVPATLLALFTAFSAQKVSTDPIPLRTVPTAYPLSLTLQDADIQNQIRNTLAHYPLAIDGKNFDALDRVFTADAVANYSAPIYIVTGLPAIKTTLEQALRPVLSQHSYGTQVIEIEKDERTARSVTYYTASHFGTGNKTGKVLYSYAQYQDNLVRVSDGWRVKQRNLIYMAPNTGDISIFTP